MLEQDYGFIRYTLVKAVIINDKVHMEGDSARISIGFYLGSQIIYSCHWFMKSICPIFQDVVSKLGERYYKGNKFTKKTYGNFYLKNYIHCQIKRNSN